MPALGSSLGYCYRSRQEGERCRDRRSPAVGSRLDLLLAARLRRDKPSAFEAESSCEPITALTRARQQCERNSRSSILRFRLRAAPVSAITCRLGLSQL